jgi:hypothetical protein
VLARLRSNVPPGAKFASIPPPTLSSASAVGDDVRQMIHRAIRVGAPAYDRGEPDVCERIYRETASEIIGRAGSRASQDHVAMMLQKALQDAAGRQPQEAAWVFRHAFDAILATR